MSNQPQQKTEQIIKTYHGSIGLFGLGGPAEKLFQRDAARLAQEGWRVQNVAQSGQLAGKARTITVVYVRERQG